MWVWPNPQKTLLCFLEARFLLVSGFVNSMLFRRISFSFLVRGQVGFPLVGLILMAVSQQYYRPLDPGWVMKLPLTVAEPLRVLGKRGAGA